MRPCVVFCVNAWLALDSFTHTLTHDQIHACMRCRGPEQGVLPDFAPQDVRQFLRRELCVCRRESSEEGMLYCVLLTWCWNRGGALFSCFTHILTRHRVVIVLHCPLVDPPHLTGVVDTPRLAVNPPHLRRSTAHKTTDVPPLVGGGGGRRGPPLLQPRCVPSFICMPVSILPKPSEDETYTNSNGCSRVPHSSA